VKVDTGLGRNGLTPADLPAVVDEALRLEAEGVVRLVGIWSHLAFADEPGHPSLHAQGDVLRAAAADAEARGARFEVRHIAASASTLTDPELHLDLVRPGIALYGLTPVPQLGGPERFGLVPAMTVEAELANVKRLPAGHGVSYGHHYVTPRDTVVGVVPLGYGDGVPRHASGQDGAPGAPLGVAGRRLAIAGRVCMDQVMVDLGPGATEQAGDRVVLFGTGADGGPTAQDWADAAGTISYEIVTRLGARVPRVYVDGGREVPASGAERVAEGVA
jgi:alanine racemase